jgi:vacuolar-type H+-ATPase subunit E/Vma4
MRRRIAGSVQRETSKYLQMKSQRYYSMIFSQASNDEDKGVRGIEHLVMSESFSLVGERVEHMKANVCARVDAQQLSRLPLA